VGPAGGGRRGPSGWLIGRGGPELGVRLEHDLALREASGAPAGRGLSHLAFHHPRTYPYPYP